MADDDEHRVDIRLFRVGDPGFERRGAEIRVHAHHGRAEFVHDRLGVIHQPLVIVERDDMDLVGRAVTKLQFTPATRDRATGLKLRIESQSTLFPNHVLR